MRFSLLLVVLVTFSATGHAQAHYRPVGDTGFGFEAGTSFDDAADAVGSAIATVAPSFDLAFSVGWVSREGRSARVVGGRGTYWLLSETPTRAGVRAGTSYLDAGGQTAFLFSLGAVAAQQVSLNSEVLVVPSLSADVVYVESGDFASGFQTSVTGGAAVVVQELGGARIHAGPTLSYNTEGGQLTFGAKGGILF